jgi:CBS domain-containing protein
LDTSEISYRVADFLKQHAPFQVAEMNDLLAMAARGRVRFHEQNEYILWQGEPHRLQVFVIQQGTVSLWDETAGSSQLLDIRGTGDMLGIERYTGARSCPHTARSESDVVLYAFPADDFEACVLKYPQAVQYVTAEGRSTPDYQPGGAHRGLQHTFLHDLLGHRALVTCRLEDRLTDVAGRLLASRSEAVAVVDDGGRAVGVLTVASVLRWAAAGGGDAHATIGQLPVPITPLPTVAPDASLSDGLLAMGSAGAEALAVTVDGTREARLQALVTASDFTPVFGDHPVGLLSEIGLASSTTGLREINRRARAFALAHLNEPSSTEWLARFLHLVDRAIVTQIIKVTDVSGVTGCWCFVGSSGREESLTKLAPQPVVVLEGDEQQERARRTYTRVLEVMLECDYLPRAASSFEPDFYVASVSEWKSRYRHWVADPVRHQMYRARSLFDLRPVVGAHSLWEQVEAEIRAAVDLDFVRILANDCLATLPPLTFFQDAVIDRGGEQVATFHLERTALRPLVDVGRVFGIATGAFLGRSTLDRFAAARTRLPEHQAIFGEAADTMRTVLQQQARVGISQGTTGSDLPPSLLSSYDRRVLKGGFRSILRLLEFTNDPAWLDQL